MTGKEKKKGNLAIRIMILIILVLVVAVAVLYLGISMYFKSHFLPGTSINGVDCSRKTVKEVKEQIQDKLMEYNLTVKERDDVSEEITSKMLEITYVDDNAVEELMENQDHFAWITSMRGNKKLEVTANMTYNREGIDGILDQMACFDPEKVQAPVNASIQENENGYAIVPESQGNTLKREEVKNAILEAVDSGKTEMDLEELDLYEKPAIVSTDEALNQELNQLNTITNAKIVYDFKDRQYTVDKTLIKEWMVKGEDGAYSIDSNKAAEWVRQMAYDTDTYSLAREFKTHSGVTIQMPKHRGDYGWVINKDKTTEALVEAIQNGVQETREPVYLYKGVAREINDIGGTYVEISITEQKMWCYKDGKLAVETPIVTGNHASGHDTPSGGVWAIDGKKADFHMKRYNADVDFWLPFNGDVGIHDASWRTPAEYNTETYKTAGSHGCINTPRDAMEKIFNIVEIGYPVVVYYSTDQVVGPEPSQSEMGA